MIKKERKILGTEQKDAVVKTMYFATNFDGKCSINVGNFLSMDARKDSLSNAVVSQIQVKETEKSKKLLDEINAKVYELLNLQEEFEGGEEC